MTIDDFIAKLSDYKTTETVFNMYYGNSKTATKCRERLKEYLKTHKNAKIVLVGEAPGYNGCAKTGVPFGSDTGEMSSKIIKGILETEHSGVDVLMWNAFPFHPHKKGNLNSNRKPNAEELSVGYKFMNAFMTVFPDAICFGAVGKVAEESLKKHHLRYKPIYIRHPSYGGKEKCRQNLSDAFEIFDKHVEEYSRNLKKYGRWPEEITEEKNAEFLDKIKLNYIQTLECERSDPFYDSAFSPWMMWIRLDVYGQRVRVYISDDSKFYKKFLDMVDKSGEFDLKTQVPEMYGQFEYKRK